MVTNTCNYHDYGCNLQISVLQAMVNCVCITSGLLNLYLPIVTLMSFNQ